MFLVDASVWVALAEEDSDHREAAASLVRGQGSSLAALDLTFYEVCNALGIRQRNPEQAQRVVRLLLRCCRERVLRVDEDLLGAALALAAEHGLSAYDAAYVAAARRTGSQLVSIDLRDLVSKGLAVTPDAAV